MMIHKTRKIVKSLLNLIKIQAIIFLIGTPIGMIIGMLITLKSTSIISFLEVFVILLSIFLSIHGLFTIIWMLYHWDDPEKVESQKSPKDVLAPMFSFTALLPARHEERVIKDTIFAIDKINYPEHLKEILILCREDDTATIQKAKEAIKEINKKNIRIITFNDLPINKPHSLNIGLKEAKNEIITIFDAEDQPHPDIFNIINTTMLKYNVDAVQSGVQLMNYRSHWFSTLNVLEYFLWFKSGLHFFSEVGKVAPLGGNTVFFKKDWINSIGGWDENCLTEDADLGIRLTVAGAKLKVIYDELHVTQEETPDSTSSFIKQRTRWNQGFLQIFFKRDWLRLKHLRQQLTAIYILLTPLFEISLLIITPFSLYFGFTEKLPVLVTMLSFLPFYILMLQLLILVIALYNFTNVYKIKSSILVNIWMPLKIILTYYPYQFLLIISCVRAIYRSIINSYSWEKTLHVNAHRENMHI